MKKMLLVLISLSFVLSGNIYSQNIFHERGHFHADSLTEVSVTGTVIVDTAYLNPVYFLDENGDGISDYHLNFGPIWYTPDSSDAVRPNDGSIVTILGGLHESQNSDYDVIVVYEIDGNFWREPFNPYWNNLSKNHRRIADRRNACSTSSFGWNHDSLVTAKYSGTVMIDETFYIDHYYLDVNNDQLPDYFLNFGPYWYEAESGAVRPLDGDQVTLTGGVITRDSMSTIIVYEINGLKWRDPANFNSNLRRGWIGDNIKDSVWFNTPYDSLTRIKFNTGWRKAGHQGGMMSDSIFCQILEVYPENMPNSTRQRIFAGFEIGIFEANGMNNMRNNSGCGGRMSFGSSVKVQLHYTEAQLTNYGIDENSICLKYWDDSQDEYITVSNAVIDYQNNIVTYSSTEMSSYVVLAPNNVTGINDISDIIDDNYKLMQNYPNPFNPATTIEFSIPTSGFVTLSVFDALGREVKTLINDNLNAGFHSINFDASNLSSGIYFYRLKSGNKILVKKLSLLK